MNKKAQKGTFGFALLLIVFLVIITSFVTIEPLKEALDDARDSSSLNCKGTLNFNQTAYDEDNDNTLAKLTRRPTCFVTGLTMIYFVGSILVGIFIWLGVNWRKIR